MKPYVIMKRILDFVFAILISILLSPLSTLAVFLIKLDSKGPILFRQKRPGINGKIFTIYKFRTMRVETNCNGRKLTDIERMTRVGKIIRRLSIDELPQLVNILKGDMSFIGPRPLLVHYIEFYTPEQMRRHDVRPGISGWAQVNGRNKLSWEEKFELDLWYVDNISFFLDLKIFLMTLSSIIKRKGINQSENNTMQQFVGYKENIKI